MVLQFLNCSNFCGKTYSEAFNSYSIRFPIHKYFVFEKKAYNIFI